MVDIIFKAVKVIFAKQLWVNPDCGLKTRVWPETKAAFASDGVCGDGVEGGGEGIDESLFFQPSGACCEVVKQTESIV